MRTHINILGWLHIVTGGLGLLGALALMGIITGFSALGGDAAAVAFGLAIGGLIASVFAIMALPNLLVGIGLLRRWRWARIGALILAFLNLFNFPLGTVVGIYTFWALFQPAAKREFAEDDGL